MAGLASDEEQVKAQGSIFCARCAPLLSSFRNAQESRTLSRRSVLCPLEVPCRHKRIGYVRCHVLIR